MARLNAITILAVAVLAAPLYAQTAKPVGGPKTNTLAVGGDVPTPLTITPAELKTYPRTTVKVTEDDRTSTYEGVSLGDILNRAGAPVGAKLRGNNVASYITCIANDGYQVVFSLAEVDPGFTSNEFIVADTIDGKPLFDYQGPFRIVAPHDKAGARSIRMLERIDLVRLRK